MSNFDKICQHDKDEEIAGLGEQSSRRPEAKRFLCLTVTALSIALLFFSSSLPVLSSNTRSLSSVGFGHGEDQGQFSTMHDDDDVELDCLASFFPLNDSDMEYVVATKSTSTTTHSSLRQSPPPSSFDELFLQKVYYEPDHERCYDSVSPEDCNCWNPLVASMPADDEPIWRKKAWPRAWQENQRLIQQAQQQQDNNNGRPLDIIMLGDSITEHWTGMRLGAPMDVLQGNRQVFQELFAEETQGLALGISGDRCPQLLYRLKNGILGIRPRVWWILIGTNDIVGGQCSINQVVACNMEIAREILRLQPEARVVINSLLPVADPHRDVSAAFWPPMLWESVYRPTNRKLACYASTQERVDFFSATDIFMTQGGAVVADRLPDGIHPGELGSRLWGQAIVNRVKEIIKDDDGR